MLRLETIQQCNNKLAIVTHNYIKYVFSYDRLIGVIYNGVFLLDGYYKNYSTTTNRHIHYNKYNVGDHYVIKSDTFDSIIHNETLTLNRLKEVIDQLFINDKLHSLILRFKYNLNISTFENDFKNLKNDILQITDNPLNIDQSVKVLKTVTQLKIKCSINQISFNLILSFSNNKNKKLKNIRLEKIKRDYL